MKSSLSSILDQSVITAAVEYLRSGELVAFPTETVYGLGADASNEKALEKLYAVKGRPANHPVIVHLASAEQISNWCVELSDYARLLARHFWPGPLTLIVKKAKHISSLITGGQDTIALRVPAHPIALAVLKAFAGGIAAPSANKYGRLSATCSEHVYQEFGETISLIIDGGNCPIGIESTIVDVTGPLPKILRPGIILEQDILEQAGLGSDTCNLNTNLDDSGKRIRVPGSDKSHYAPRTPMLLLDSISLQSFLAKGKSDDKSIGQLSYAAMTFNMLDQPVKQHIQASAEPRAYARDLYANLRKLDNCGASYILVEIPPQSAEWLAIFDRLKRAATKL